MRTLQVGEDRFHNLPLGTLLKAPVIHQALSATCLEQTDRWTTYRRKERSMKKFQRVFQKLPSSRRLLEPKIQWRFPAFCRATSLMRLFQRLILLQLPRISRPRPTLRMEMPSHLYRHLGSPPKRPSLHLRTIQYKHHDRSKPNLNLRR